jgi:hypothetical protein
MVGGRTHRSSIRILKPFSNPFCFELKNRGIYPNDKRSRCSRGAFVACCNRPQGSRAYAIAQGRVVVAIAGHIPCNAWAMLMHSLTSITTRRKKRRASLRRTLRLRSRPAPKALLGSGRIFPVAEGMIAIEQQDFPNHWPRIGGMDRLGSPVRGGRACVGSRHQLRLRQQDLTVAGKALRSCTLRRCGRGARICAGLGHETAEGKLWREWESHRDLFRFPSNVLIVQGRLKRLLRMLGHRSTQANR